MFDSSAPTAQQRLCARALATAKPGTDSAAAAILAKGTMSLTVLYAAFGTKETVSPLKQFAEDHPSPMLHCKE